MTLVSVAGRSWSHKEDGVACSETPSSDFQECDRVVDSQDVESDRECFVERRRETSASSKLTRQRLLPNESTLPRTQTKLIL